MDLFDDTYFMKRAFSEAQRAWEEGEVPVGAVVVAGNRIIGRAHNLTERLTDVTAHAEMQAITAASNLLGSKYLNECILYGPGALRDVRRSTGMGPAWTTGLWCSRRKTGLYKVCAAGASPPYRGRGRRPG